MLLFLEALEYFFIGLALLFAKVTPVSLMVGFYASLFGIFGLIWSYGHIRPGRVDGADVSGPWQFVRHPEIIARFMWVFGLMLVSRVSWIYALAILLLGMLYKRKVVEGDADLRYWLGPSFVVYRLLTPSFLPQFFPAKLPQYSMRVNIQKNPWSYRTALKSKELRWACIIFSLVSLFLYIALLWEAPYWVFRLVGLLPLARACYCIKDSRLDLNRSLSQIWMNLSSKKFGRPIDDSSDNYSSH